MVYKRIFFVTGAVAVLLLTFWLSRPEPAATIQAPEESFPDSEVLIRGLLFNNTDENQLTLLERWEEPYYIKSHMVDAPPAINLEPFINRIVIVRLEKGQEDQAPLVPLGFERVEDLTETERVKWIRFIVLNDLDRLLAKEQASLFIKNDPDSEYVPNIYYYLASVYIYDKEFSAAIDVLTDFVSQYPDDEFFIERFQREISRLRQTYLDHPSYGEFIANRDEWQQLKPSEISRHTATLMAALEETKAESEKGPERSDIIGLLAHSGTGEAIAYLLNYPAGAHKGDRMAVVRAMQPYIEREDVKQYYVQSLDSDLASIRLQAAQVLGEAKADRNLVDRLILVLADRDERVVRAAALALGKLGDPRAAEALGSLAGSANPLIRSGAEIALAKIKDHE